MTLHTSLGDVNCEIFCDEVPKTAEGFMIQGGDPTNTGEGGTSIWGKKFNDETRESLKFFSTYARQPHLNGLYTIFGKVIHGFEVLDIMEKAQGDQVTDLLWRSGLIV